MSNAFHKVEKVNKCDDDFGIDEKKKETNSVCVCVSLSYFFISHQYTTHSPSYSRH